MQVSWLFTPILTIAFYVFAGLFARQLLASLLDRCVQAPTKFMPVFPTAAARRSLSILLDEVNRFRAYTHGLTHANVMDRFFFVCVCVCVSFGGPTLADNINLLCASGPTLANALNKQTS